MATFKEQVKGLTGLEIESSGSNPTNDQLTQFLKDAVVEVINRIIVLRPDEISKFTATSNSHTHIEKTGKIFSVVREHDSPSILRNCTPINPAIRHEATDINSFNYRSKYNPGFYELDGNIHIIPVASGTGDNDIILLQLKINGTYGDIIQFKQDDFPLTIDKFLVDRIKMASSDGTGSSSGANEIFTIIAFH